MTIRSLAFALLLPILLAASAVPARAAEDPSGRWALRADGRPLMILTLQPDPAEAGRWRGELVRPEGTTLNQSHIAFGMRNAIDRKLLVGTTAAEGTIELKYVDPKPDQVSDVLTFTPIEAGFALWGYKGVPFEPMLMLRARPEESVSAGWDPAGEYGLDEPWPSNAAIRRLFEEDQAARRVGRIDWSVVGPQDAARREAVRRLLDAGALKSGDDFWHAAFIFQHGDKPEDFLLAHSLAIIAAARGRRDATWIAAATLDRYLMRIGRKQIYGTQYITPNDGGPVTQEQFDRTTVSDALRIATGVPSLSFQEERRREMEAQRRAPVPVPGASR